MKPPVSSKLIACEFIKEERTSFSPHSAFAAVDRIGKSVSEVVANFI